MSWQRHNGCFHYRQLHWFEWEYYSHIDSHTQEHMPIDDCALLPLQCSWKQQMHELMSPDFTITNLTLPHMNYILWGWQTNPPQTLPCVPVLFNYAENWIYVVVVMLSRWLLTGGIWANLREQGDFLLLLWFALIQDYTKTPPYSTTTFSTTTASISWLISIQFSLKT